MQNIFCRNSFSKVNFATLTTLSIVLILVLLGIVVLLTASQPIDSSLPQKQLLWILISILFGLIFFKLDLEKIRPLIPYFGLFSLILLVLVLIPGIGQKVNGAQRWISFGFINLQVSEIAKLGLLLTLSDYLSVFRLKIDSFYNGFLLPNIILFLFAGLIFLEPDYGTAFLCGLVGYILFFVSGVNIKFLLISSISALGLFILAILNNQERLSRIISFLDVESHKLDSGYQLWQGIIAFGVGGINGVGIGSGRQQMSFLPEAHTDFIFAVIGEELGLMGCAFVILCYFYFGSSFSFFNIISSRY